MTPREQARELQLLSRFLLVSPAANLLDGALPEVDDIKKESRSSISDRKGRAVGTTLVGIGERGFWMSDSKDVFNLMGFSGGTFTADIETWRLVEVGHAYLDLLDGKITAGPSDTSFMPGCRGWKRRHHTLTQNE